MQFIVTSFPPSDNPNPNTCYLKKDNWDDFGFKTTFGLSYSDDKGELVEIGFIRIMQKGQEIGKVTLPSDNFEFLDESYCSLGYSQSYYEEMFNIPEPVRSKILESLRDCVHNSDIFDDFKSEHAMQASLLRDLSIRNVKFSFKNILLNNIDLTAFHFLFRLKSMEDCEIKVMVVPESTPPTNVHVLIGRNGAGKTRILSGIADALTGNEKDHKSISLHGDIIFPDEEEDGRFANLVTIVFSVFDRFTPIKPNIIDRKILYQYVGLKKYSESSDEQKTGSHIVKTLDDLKEEFKNSLKVCLSSLRKSRWQEAIRILNSDPIIEDYKLDELAEDDDPIEKMVNIFEELSSGHRITILSITKLVELVDERTLVLIDEPETHLHPPLLASFIRALSNLLIKRNGVALIATHSPVILQEVPKSCVTIIHRVGTVYKLSSPRIETFGENVGTLTSEVFNLEVKDSGFHKMIQRQLESENYEDLIKKFGGQIGAEGRAIARSISVIKDKKND